MDARGKTVAPGNLRAQTTRALRNLFVALKAAGATRAQVLRTTIYVASSSRADLVAAWKVVRASFAGHDPPSTLLGVCTLGYPDQLVEIEATAVSARLPK